MEEKTARRSENAPLHDAARDERRRTKGARQRLFESRWLLGASAATLGFAFLTDNTSVVFFIGAVIFLGCVAAFAPRKSKKVRILRAKPLVKKSVWPTTQVKLFVDASLDPCAVLDGDGLVRYVNAKFKDLFAGVNEADPFTMRFREPRIVDAIQGMQRAEKAFAVAYKMRQPVERDFDVWLTPIRAPGASLMSVPDFILVQFRDKTDFQRLDTLRSDFIANVSHELRTPIASLTGFIETLQGNAKNDEASRERFLKIMLEQAQRMTRLVNDLLSLSRIELRSHVMPEETADLADAVAHVVDSLGPLSRENDMVIEYDRPSTPCFIAGDRDEIVQVFQNLIENACKYGEGGSCVDVRIYEGEAPLAAKEELPAECHIVEVKDYGVGISQENLPRLTERFFRADVEVSRQKLGTGLGLALVKHILARHRAHMDVESELGRGSTFRVYFAKTMPNVQTDKSPNLKLVS